MRPLHACIVVGAIVVWYLMLSAMYSTGVCHDVGDVKRVEAFAALTKEPEGSLYTLRDAADIVVYQGSSLPPQPIAAPLRLSDCTDSAVTTVSADPKDPEAMFMFAYNRCSPSCCATSSFGCNGGCVCVTEAQRKFIQRGGGTDTQQA